MKKHVALLIITVIVTVGIILNKQTFATPAESLTSTPSTAKPAIATDLPEQSLTKTTFEKLTPETITGMAVILFLGVGFLLIYFKKTKNHTAIPAHCYELI